jgi:hypothetical protein
MPADVNEHAVLIELDAPKAQDVVRAAVERGAAPYPVGGESRYEMVPLFYRLASTFVRAQPEVVDSMFRINPHRAGPTTVQTLLKGALAEVF